MSMFNPPHPGAIIREEVIRPLGLSVSEAAERLGVSRTALSRVINEHAAVSPSLAQRLEMAGVSSASVWIGMQAKYDLYQSQLTPPKGVRKLVDA